MTMARLRREPMVGKARKMVTAPVIRPGSRELAIHSVRDRRHPNLKV